MQLQLVLETHIVLRHCCLFAMRGAVTAGQELLLAQSYAKNMGLYGERVGALSVVCSW